MQPLLRESGECPGERSSQEIALVTDTRAGCDEKNLFGSQSRTWLKEWNITLMERGAKPEECLGQANFDKSQGVFHQSLGFKNTILRESGG